MKEQILTAYGPMEIDVRRIVGSRIFVTHERHVFPAGIRTRGDGKLKKPFVVPRGAVLVPAWENFEGKNPELLHRIFPGGIYEALRGVTHAIRKYGLEKGPGEIQVLRAASDRLAANLSTLMQGKRAREHELVWAKRDLATLALELEHSLDELKAAAAEKIAAASTLQVEHPSGKKSQNIPATVERLRAAKRRIDGRLERVHRIGPRIGFYEKTLAQAIGRIFDDLGSLRNDLERERRYIKMAFSQKIRNIFADRVDRIAERLLPHLDAEPFLKTAKMIRVDLAKARAAKGKKFTLDAVDRILVAIRLKEAQRAFENNLILPFTLRLDLGIASGTDFLHTRRRLANFVLRFNGEIDDAGFIRPVKNRVLAECSAVLFAFDKLVFSTKPDVDQLKERLKTISHML